MVRQLVQGVVGEPAQADLEGQLVGSSASTPTWAWVRSTRPGRDASRSTRVAARSSASVSAPPFGLSVAPSKLSLPTNPGTGQVDLARRAEPLGEE